jgi:hypothetical protein
MLKNYVKKTTTKKQRQEQGIWEREPELLGGGLECPLSALRSLLNRHGRHTENKKRVRIKFDKDRGSRSFAVKQLDVVGCQTDSGEKNKIWEISKRATGEGGGRLGWKGGDDFGKLGKSVTMTS